MSDLPNFIPVSALPAANDEHFETMGLQDVLARTHDAAGVVVDFQRLEASEVGFRALLRAGNVLNWFRSGVTPGEVAEYANIVDALNSRRAQIAKAANDERFALDAAERGVTGDCVEMPKAA